jgi:hypothetical protein
MLLLSTVRPCLPGRPTPHLPPPRPPRLHHRSTAYLALSERRHRDHFLRLFRADWSLPSLPSSLQHPRPQASEPALASSRRLAAPILLVVSSSIHPHLLPIFEVKHT